jgi:opacity protein-like surface antigen
MVVSTYDGDLEGAEAITANIGVGYQVMDGITVGLVMAKDALGEDSYELFGRYDLGAYAENAYASIQMPTEEATDNMKIGVGYTFTVWNGLAIEPNYTMPVNADDAGEREGSFNIGVAYRF